MSQRLKSLLSEENAKGRDVEVMVWTTTPWTLSANMVRTLNCSHGQVLIMAVRVSQYIQKLSIQLSGGRTVQL